MRLLHVLLLFVVWMAVLVPPQSAHADILNLTLNPVTCQDYNASAKQFNGGHRNVFGIAPAGTPMTPEAQIGACGTAQAGFFSRFICMFETTLGMVIATFFCSVQQTWMPPFAALLMVFMAGMGIMFITGIVEFTVKDMAIMMFKIGLITTFAFNADMAIGVAFKGFLALTQNSVEMFSSVFTSSTTHQPISPTFEMADTHVGGTVGDKPAPNCQFSGPLGAAGLTLFFLAIFFFLPFIFGIFILATIAGLAFFARAAFGYLYSLVMLTFLIAAMPIFVSFALFATTRSLFDSWVSYLLSNSLQIMLVFAFLAFAGSVNITDFFTDISRLLTNYEVAISIPPFSLLLGDISLGTVCTICTPNIIDDPHYLAMTPSLKMPIIAPNPNQCLNPDGLAWTQLPFQTDFIIYLVTHGVAIYVLASVLSELMKEAPDMAHALAGSGAAMIIGGISRNYGQGGDNSLKVPGLTDATVNFEKGFARAWKTGKTFDTEGKNRLVRILSRSAPGRILAALALGAEDVKYGTSNLSKAEAKQRERKKRIGKARANQKKVQSAAEVKRQEFTIENLEKAKKELEEKNAASQKVIEELRRDAEQSKLLGNIQSQEMKELEGKIIQSEIAMQKMETGLVAKQGALIDLKAAIEKKGAEVVTDPKALAVKEKEVKALNDQYEAARQEYAALEQKLQQERQSTDQQYKEHGKMAQKQQEEALTDIQKQMMERQKEIDEARARLKGKEDDEEVKRLLREMGELEGKMGALNASFTQGGGALMMSSLEYRIAEMTLKENTLALNEVETRLSSAHGSLSNAEEAVKEAKFQAEEWDRKTSDARYSRGSMDTGFGWDPDHEEIGIHGGMIDAIWGRQKDMHYFGDVKDRRRDTWETLMHLGDG